MTFSNFYEQIQTELNHIFKNKHLPYKAIIKPSGVGNLNYTSIVIMGKEKQRNDITAGLSIPLEPLFQAYKDGNITLQDIIATILEQHHQQAFVLRHDRFQHLDSWEHVKSDIIPQICNYELNRNTCTRGLFDRLGEFIVKYYITIDEDKGLYTPVNYHLLNSYHISEQELKDTAWDNYWRDYKTTFTLTDPLNHQYCLGNTKQFYGSNILAKPNVLAKITSDLQDDLYIVPVSTTNVLIAPAQKVHQEPDYKKRLLHALKDTITMSGIEFDANMFLSSHLYFFDRNTKTLTQLNDKDITAETIHYEHNDYDTSQDEQDFFDFWASH